MQALQLGGQSVHLPNHSTSRFAHGRGIVVIAKTQQDRNTEAAHGGIMTSIKQRDWVSIGANVAVFAGLILVAVQINQNNATIRSSSYQMWVASNMELNAAATQLELSATLESGWLDSRGLSKETFIQFAMWNMSVMQMAQATDYMYRQEAIDQSLWETEIDRAALFLTAPGVRPMVGCGRQDATHSGIRRLDRIDHVNSDNVELDAGAGIRAGRPIKQLAHRNVV